MWEYKESSFIYHNNKRDSLEKNNTQYDLDNESDGAEIHNIEASHMCNGRNSSNSISTIQ